MKEMMDEIILLDINRALHRANVLKMVEIYTQSDLSWRGIKELYQEAEKVYEKK